MAVEVRVPTTGNAGEEAVIVEWHVEVGSTVTSGQVLATLETAKATLEVESPADGELLRVDRAAGDEVPEHAIIGMIGEPGETLADPSGPDVDSSETPAPAATALDDADATRPRAGASLDASPAEPSPPVRIAISPRARILAERRGVDPAGLAGTGPGGRVIVPDVLAATPATAAAAGTAPTATPTAPAATASVAEPVTGSVADDEGELVPLRGARKVTAQRMLASLQTTAQLTMTRYADGGALFDWAARIREETDRTGAPKIGINDLVLYATARALAGHPEANSTIDDDGIRRYRRVNLGFAVDTGTALLVPVIRNAAELTLAELSAESRRLVERARTSGLTAEEMSGGTFTVSNLGSAGIHWFTPVLNPPQTGILGVGAAHQSHPDGPRAIPLSYTFDHRALDGAPAAAVLASIARAIEAVDLLAAL